MLSFGSSKTAIPVIPATHVPRSVSAFYDLGTRGRHSSGLVLNHKARGFGITRSSGRQDRQLSRETSNPNEALPQRRRSLVNASTSMRWAPGERRSPGASDGP